MAFVLGFCARYLGDAKKLSKVLAQGFDPDIGKKLMQPLAAFVTAASALRPSQFENVTFAVRQRPTDVIDREVFELPRLVTFWLRESVYPTCAHPERPLPPLSASS